MSDLRELAENLQSGLARIDLLSRPSRPTGGFIEFLIAKRDNLKFKIYQEPGHNLPHIHIDYGKNPHAASYGIDPPVRLAGRLAKEQDRYVLTWLTENKTALLDLWDTLQAGNDPGAASIALRGDV